MSSGVYFIIAETTFACNHDIRHVLEKQKHAGKRSYMLVLVGTTIEKGILFLSFLPP